jgi:formyl-CoA transferase/CoA:oxalate CoA-transferase
MFLGDLGAEVIKIELGEGDTTRSSSGPNHFGESYHFLSVNRNKKSMLLDLSTESGKDVFYNLVRISDVIFSALRPGSLEKLCCDYNSVKEINSRIIVCSLTGYGSSGPYRDRPSWDPIVSALSGLTSLIGEPNGSPMWTQIPFVDQMSGIYAALGVVTALFYREKTGVGQKVEVAMLDVAASLLTHFATRYFLSGELPKRLGSGHHASVPFGVFATKEGYISIGPCWPRICRALGADWLVDDPRFATHADRMDHRDELNAIIAGLFLKEKAEDWLEILYAEDIPAAPVNTIDKALADPQIVQNNMVITIDHPLGGKIKMVGLPIKMSASSRRQYLPPPLLGQHTDEILLQLLNYSRERIQKLEE